MRVSEAGGEAQPLTTGNDDVQHRWMDSLPDGKGVLFTLYSGSTDAARIAVQSPDMTEPMVLADGTDPKYVPTGHIVFARAYALWAMPFDLEQLTVTGSQPRCSKTWTSTLAGSRSLPSSMTVRSFSFPSAAGPISNNNSCGWTARESKNHSTNPTGLRPGANLARWETHRGGDSC